MKKIEAIIREDKLDAVRQALIKTGYWGMIVSEVGGRGRQQGLALESWTDGRELDLLQKVKLEFAVLDADTQKVVDAIAISARTGDIGGGKIFVLPLEDAVNTTTAENRSKPSDAKNVRSRQLD